MVTRAQFPSVNFSISTGISIAKVRVGRTFRANARAPPESTDIAWWNEFRKRRNPKLFLLIPGGAQEFARKVRPKRTYTIEIPGEMGAFTEGNCARVTILVWF